MTHDVFISHSSQDRAIGEAACAALEKCGYRCWIAPRDILPGDDYGEAIVDGIRASRIFLLVVSAHSVASPQVRRETERAANAGLPIVPFRIEDVLPSKSLEFFISSAHWLDAISRPLDPHLDYLCRVVERLLAEADGATVPPMPMRALGPHAAPPPVAASPARAIPSRSAIALVAVALVAVLGGFALWRGMPGEGPAAVNQVLNGAAAKGPNSIFTRRATTRDDSKPVMMRAEARVDAPVIETIGTRDIFLVAPRNSDWWYAQLESGQQGFVHSLWIRVIDGESASTPTDNGQQPANAASAAPGNAQ